MRTCTCFHHKPHPGHDENRQAIGVFIGKERTQNSTDEFSFAGNRIANNVTQFKMTVRNKMGGISARRFNEDTRRDEIFVRLKSSEHFG
jgi:hypothetical protein